MSRDGRTTETLCGASGLHGGRLARVLLSIGLVLGVIYVGKPILFPVTLAVIVTMLLLPISRLLEGWRIPRPLAATLVVGSFVAASIAVVALLRAPALEWLERAPESVAGLQRELEELRGPVDQVVEAADQVEEMAEGSSGRETSVRMDDSSSLSGTLLSGTRKVVSLGALVAVLVVFFLTYRSVLLAKLVALMPHPEARRRALAASAAVRDRLAHYFVAKAAINTGLGVGVGLTLWAAGYGNPVLWGVMAGVLNIVPYLGSMTGIAIVTVVGLLTLDGYGAVAAGAGGYALLTSLEGMWVTPMILGRRLSIDPVAILLGVLVAGVLWGPAGILLTVPVLVCIKVVAEHYPGGRMLSLLLGRGASAVRLLARTRTLYSTR
jgi:predicted PurR-regulated permease PerM